MPSRVTEHRCLGRRRLHVAGRHHRSAELALERDQMAGPQSRHRTVQI